MSSDFPLIYCNGCSYSDDHYDPLVLNRTYSHVVGSHFGGFVINNSKIGSCNRRIVRSSAHDLILQRKQNPEQKIIALIQLTFELRDEIWVDGPLNNAASEAESNFQSNQFTGLLDWRQRLISGQSIGPIGLAVDLDRNSAKFMKKLNEGRAFFYSPYAQRINLLLDIIFLRNLMNLYNIEYIIFQGPLAEPLQQEYLLDFLKNELVSDPKIFDLEKFGFCNWCNQHHFIPLGGNSEPPHIGHYGSDAHNEFSRQCLIPLLEQQ